MRLEKTDSDCTNAAVLIASGYLVSIDTEEGLAKLDTKKQLEKLAKLRKLESQLNKRQGNNGIAKRLLGKSEGNLQKQVDSLKSFLSSEREKLFALIKALEKDILRLKDSVETTERQHEQIDAPAVRRALMQEKARLEAVIDVQRSKIDALSEQARKLE